MRPRSNVVKSVLFLVGSDFGVISIPLATAPLFVFSLKSFICNTVQSQSKKQCCGVGAGGADIVLRIRSWNYLLNKFDCTKVRLEAARMNKHN